jgi:SPP1 family predicted phage head-tail adaptor
MARRAGKLRHRVSIERRSTSFDADLGQAAGTWAEWKSVFAEVKDLSGRELERARQIVAEATVSIDIRYLTGLLTTDRIKFDGRTLQIGAVLDPENRKHDMLVVCSELK